MLVALIHRVATCCLHTPPLIIHAAAISDSGPHRLCAHTLSFLRLQSVRESLPFLPLLSPLIDMIVTQSLVSLLAPHHFRRGRSNLLHRLHVFPLLWGRHFESCGIESNERRGRCGNQRQGSTESGVRDTVYCGIAVQYGIERFFFFFCHTLNPSPSAGRVCGLKGSTHLPPVHALHFDLADWVSTPAPDCSRIMRSAST